MKRPRQSSLFGPAPVEDAPAPAFPLDTRVLRALRGSVPGMTEAELSWLFRVELLAIRASILRLGATGLVKEKPAAPGVFVAI